MKRACSISAPRTSRDSFCTRIIRPGTSITRQTLSGAGTPQRITTIFTQPPNQLQTPVRFSLQGRQCKDRTGQTHSLPRSQADERHRRSGNCRSSKRRATRRLCQKILQCDGSDATTEAVGAAPRPYSAMAAMPGTANGSTASELRRRCALSSNMVLNNMQIPCRPVG